ncbi:hypothetical protein SAICODRAFT_31076 [Saitoella complicata NRRL Y-17804]|uniref:uncharacterized protein n=1 Tax=Saitoella complicata (strain BCRC 22490 / CBS 7301 / JCM 7358 / NBRC 10748 / NRRL Y-17804) TaxID=698492 RepID=UPI00086829E6|nr:uncharacterized protein SAICODRAFT_31076 [Saitoella complicata NRRL Y-17804]ODQ51707.1 hypothetical protein SAICODRAFT_31076 [Saitoella complicata NRRL Y-17804]
MNSNTAFQLSSPPLSPTSHKTFNTVRVRPTTTRPTASSLSLLSGPTSPLATKNHGHGHRHGHHGEHTPGPSPQRPGLTRAATATADMKAETEGEKLRKMTEVLGGRLSEVGFTLLPHCTCRTSRPTRAKGQHAQRHTALLTRPYGRYGVLDEKRLRISNVKGDCTTGIFRAWLTWCERRWSYSSVSSYMI